MAERYSQGDARTAFHRLCNTLNQRIATGFDDHGAWTLDYDGYIIEVIDNDNYGVSRPFGPTRRTAREFCQVVAFAIQAVEVLRGER